MSVRFAVIDLDSNEPVAAFDSYDDAFECEQELSLADVVCMIDTVDDEILSCYRI